MEQTGRLFKQRRLSTTWLKSQITQPHKLWDAMPKQPSQEELRDCIAKVYSEESMSRKTEFKGTAASRRRARRANLQSQEAISSDKLHRPTPSRVVLQCKLKPAMRAEVITLTTLTRKYEGSTCLPNVALYAAGYRKSKQLTAR